MTKSLFTRPDVLQDRHGLKLASYLTLAATDLPQDITERLRVARQQAVRQRKSVLVHATSPAVNVGGSAVLHGGLDDDGLRWWSRIGALAPLLALVAGLLLINAIQNDSRARELAEIDVALLTDELPPAAFADPGFIQFLKSDL